MIKIKEGIVENEPVITHNETIDQENCDEDEISHPNEESCSTSEDSPPRIESGIAPFSLRFIIKFFDCRHVRLYLFFSGIVCYAVSKEYVK